MRPPKFDPSVRRWLDLMPGPFAERTPMACYELAFRNFLRCDNVGSIDNLLEFQMALGAFELGALPTGIGGFVIARK